jgi:hypothetical protein
MADHHVVEDPALLQVVEAALGLISLISTGYGAAICSSITRFGVQCGWRSEKKNSFRVLVEWIKKGCLECGPSENETKM